MLDKKAKRLYNYPWLAYANCISIYNQKGIKMTLKTATEGMEYKVGSINTGDRELEAFLFSLGCYEGEPITVISRRRSGCVIAIKDGRYSIDNALADAIEVA